MYIYGSVRLFICHHRGDVTKIQKCAENFWLGACYCILHDCIAQVDRFWNAKPPPTILLPPGGCS